MPAPASAVLLAATVTTGLIAGLLYAFACSVMPGLRGSDDHVFVDVMQRINTAILNPWFLSAFLGALPLIVVAAIQHAGAGRPVLGAIVGAGVCYALTIGITARVNVPLNTALAAAGPPGTAAANGARRRFESRWVRWHRVRTVTSIVAFGLLAWALVLHGATAVSAAG